MKFTLARFLRDLAAFTKSSLYEHTKN